MLIGNSLHVLCFGDSLTHGMTQHGTVYHPYALALQSTLQNAFPWLHVTVDERGQDGDLVASPVGHFLPRMETLYEEVQPVDPYSWAVILGGTNDIIGHQRFAADTYTALQKVWDIPLEHRTNVLALTIPECGHCGGLDEINQQRDLLNSMILNHQDETFYTFDLGAAVPFFAMPEQRRNEIWDDTIHFTAKGYDMIGTMIANRIIERINAEVVIEDQQNELKKRAAGFEKQEVDDDSRTEISARQDS